MLLCPKIAGPVAWGVPIKCDPDVTRGLGQRELRLGVVVSLNHLGCVFQHGGAGAGGTTVFQTGDVVRHGHVCPHPSRIAPQGLMLEPRSVSSSTPPPSCDGEVVILVSGTNPRRSVESRARFLRKGAVKGSS